MKHFYAFLIIAILLPSLAMAGGYESRITKIGDSQVPNGKMQLSADGKYIYVCNTNGDFAKFDIEKGAVVDTMQLPKSSFNMGELHHFFCVTNDGQHLIYISTYPTIYDLNTKDSIGTCSISRVHMYEESTIYSVIPSSNDSILIFGTHENVQNSNEFESSGKIVYYNYISKKELSGYSKGIAFDKMLLSNEGNRILCQTSYFYYYQSQGYSESRSGSSIICFNDTMGVVLNKIYNWDKLQPSVSLVYSIGLDNTGDQAFYILENGELNVYSISENKLLFNKKGFPKYTDFNFLNNNRFYIAYARNGKAISVYEKKNNSLMDIVTIDETNPNVFDGTIQDVLTAPDSSSLYTITKYGEIFRIENELFSNEPKAIFTSDKQELQFGDTITLYDNSIGKFDSRKWFINGIEQTDTSENFKYVPIQSGLHSVELQVLKDSEMKNLILTDFFNVYKLVKADFSFKIEDFNDSLGVSFTNLSFGDSLQYRWFFGDGKTSVEKNPYHTYTKTGLYKVSLIASNNRFADTTSSSTQIEFGIKSIMNIAENTNRMSSNEATDPNSDNQHYVFGRNGFKGLNSNYGYNVQSINVKSEFIHLLGITKTTFTLFDSYYLYNWFAKDTTRISGLFNDWTEGSEGERIARKSRTFQFDDSTLIIQREDTFMDKYSIGKPHINLHSVTGKNNTIKKIFSEPARQADIGEKMFILKTNNEQIVLVNSCLNPLYNNTPKSYIYKLQMKDSQTDTIAININFNFGLPDHENGKIKLISEDNNTSSIYEYSEASGLQKMFDLDNIDSLLFVDQNLILRRMLFVSKGRKATDTTLTLTITNFAGNILSTGLLEGMKVIRDIKFIDDYILISPYYGKEGPYDFEFKGDVDLLVYDNNGKLIDSYKDNLIANGYINNITHLSGNKALLVGTKFTKFDYIQNKEIPSQSELYYVVDLDNVVSVADNMNVKIEVSKIHCYPNPANSDINFKFANNENELARLTIIDPMGNEIANLQTIEDFATYPTERLAIGVYFVRGTIGSQAITGKFVVAR